MFKGEKGITLVALVVTIVVLLILAGVSISLVVGQNGMISKAKKTQVEQDRAYVRDTIETALKSLEIDYLSSTLADPSTVATMTNLMKYVDAAAGANTFTKATDTTITYKNNNETYTATVQLVDNNKATKNFSITSITSTADNKY